MVGRLTTCSVLLLVLQFGCCRQEESKPAPPPKPPAQGQAQKTEQEVIQTAKQLAEKEGYALKDYQEPKVTFDPKQNQWWVCFNHKPPQPPGGHFGVYIDDRTGEARLMRGK